MKIVKWGRYKADKLFREVKISGVLSKRQTSIDAKHPVYSSTSINNGIIGYTNNPDYICDKKTPVYIIFGDHTRTFNIAQESFSVLDNVKVLTPCTNKINSLLFIGSLWKKQIPNLGYSRHWKVARNCFIPLPQTSTGKIDYDFMESFVYEIENLRLKELELLRLRKLNAYLLAAGLNDYKLTGSDSKSLSIFDNLRWREFLIDDLFEKVETVKLPYSAKELPKQATGKNILPCLTSSFLNQGLNYYAPREGATIINHVISIPSNSDVYRAYYQPNDFTVLSDAYAIRWKDKHAKIQPEQYLFMVACINKVTNLPIYSYKNKLGGWNVVKDKIIVLPVTDDDQPDFAAMEQLITVMQKNAIADVAKYTSQHLEATRQIIESDQLIGEELVESTPSTYHYQEFDSLMAAESFERYKWEGFDQSICSFFGGNQTILIGCYKGKEYQEWIQSHNTYTIRLGKTKGSMEENKELFDSTSLLVLYELGKPEKLSAYKITGHHEISKEELIKLGYPNKKPRKRYMAFDIEPFEKDLTFLVEHHLIERLLELNANNAKGTPVFIEP